MGETISSYIDYSQNLSKSLKKIKSRIGKKPISNELDELYDISDLVNSTLTPVIRTEVRDRPSVDVATYYDLFTKVKELTETALVKENIEELERIQTETAKVIEKTAKVMTPRKANNRLLGYSSSISELSIISQSVKEICNEVNKIDNWEDIDSDEARFGEKSKNVFEGIKTKIIGIINGMKTVLVSSGTTLIDGLNNLGKAVEKLSKSAFSQFMDALNFFVEKLNWVKLKLVEGMFGFIDEVVKLAKEKNWLVSQINMTMPEIGVDFAEVNIPFLGKIVKIPLPDVTQPKVTVIFTLNQNG